MDNSLLKNLLPHIGAYVIMLLLTFVFFKPYVFDGKVLKQNDNVRARAMQAEMRQVKKETGKDPLWTNSMFGGMPTYQIKNPSRGNYVAHVLSTLLLRQSMTKPHVVILLAMALCYLFLITMKVDWRIAIMGSVAFGLSSYYMDIADEGHSTKMTALACVPGVFAGAVLAYRGKYLLGGGLFGLFLACNIIANHLQITFYLFLLLLILGLVKLIYAAKEGAIPTFAKASGILVLAGGLALLSNTSNLWTTWEYSKETIRGKSELSSKASLGGGLDKDYAFGWSYGIAESMTLLIPNYFGGGAKHSFKGTDTYKKFSPQTIRSLRQRGMSQSRAEHAADEQMAGLYYHGDQTFLGAAIYFGAIICFLFFLGAFLLKGDMKVWMLASGIFALTIAWGTNFPLNHIFFDYFPMFNKFRAVSMALGITHLCWCALAAMAVQGIFSKNYSTEKKKRAVQIAAGITAAFLLAGLIGAFTMDYVRPNDARVFQTEAHVIQGDRFSLIMKDLLRSFVLVALVAGLLYAYLLGKMKTMVAVAAIALLTIGDGWMVSKRIVSYDDHEKAKPISSEATPLPADQQIMSDPDPHYRVLDMARGNPITNVTTSNFHKSIGGYHAAKLGLFQEVYEQYLSRPGQYLNILGMLNTKYIIQGEGKAATVAKIPEATGNAWFVNEFQVVDNADQEMAAIANIDPKTKVVLQKKYTAQLGDLNFTPDPAASIKLTKYHPDKMEYVYSAASDQLAVFSEMYYPADKGWKLYIDGQPYDQDIVKANYILRAAKLPAGQNKKLEMRFEPKSFYMGETISRIASILLILLAFGSILLYFKNNGIPKADLLDEMEPAKTVTKKTVATTATRSKNVEKDGAIATKKKTKKKSSKKKDKK